MMSLEGTPVRHEKKTFSGGKASVDRKGKGDASHELRMAKFDGLGIGAIDQFKELEVFGESGGLYMNSEIARLDESARGPARKVASLRADHSVPLRTRALRRELSWKSGGLV